MKGRLKLKKEESKEGIGKERYKKNGRLERREGGQWGGSKKNGKEEVRKGGRKGKEGTKMTHFPLGV